MSVKVKITKAIGGRQAGDTINVTPKTADLLKDAGLVEEKPTRTKKTTEKGGGDSPAA